MVGRNPRNLTSGEVDDILRRKGVFTKDFQLQKILSGLRSSRTSGEFFTILREGRDLGFSNEQILRNVSSNIRRKFGV